MIPASFASRTVAVYGDSGREWLEALPATLAELSEAWGVRIGPPFANLTYNYVAPAEDRDGARSVVKIGPASPEGAREPLALQAFGGNGAIRLYRQDLERSAMLLERVDLGDDLLGLSHPEAVGVAADVLRELWKAPPPDGLPDLTEWTATLKRFEREPGPLPRELIVEAAVRRRDLLQDPPERVLLHADLHHTNVLRSAERGWLAIDPKGVVGERAYDIVAFLLNPGPVAPEVTRWRIDAFVERLALDRERILGWALVQAVVSACWTVEDNETGWENAIEFAQTVSGRRLNL